MNPATALILGGAGTALADCADEAYPKLGRLRRRLKAGEPQRRARQRAERR